MTETKKLGLVDLVAISCGQVIGAGVVTLIGTAIVATGTSAWLAYGAAVVVGFISIIPFIFISSTTMLQGGEYSIVADMLNEKMAGFYSTAFISQCLSLSLLGTSLGSYVNSIFPEMNGRLIGLIAVCFFFALNLLGVNMMANAQKILSAILVIALLIFGIYGMTMVNPAVYDISSPGFFTEGYGGFVNAIAIYAFSTYGQYMVMNFSKDAKNPTRDIPLAILISTGVILILYVTVAIANCGVLPIEEVAGKPLTLAAKEIFGNLYPVFIIGGPVMALMTTMNSTYGSRANPLLRAASDGWFPASIAKMNKRNVPYIIMTLIFLVGIIPLLAGLSIKTITNNLVLVGYTLRMVTAVSIIRLPKLMPEQWKKSFLHVPDSVFYTIMILTFAANFYMVYLSARGLTTKILLINVVFIVFCAIYAVARYNSGKVNLESAKH